MSETVIENPIINSPYVPPTRHFAFDRDGITSEIVPERRKSSYFVPVPRPRKGSRQLEIPQVVTYDDIRENKQVNEIRARVDNWRRDGWPGVTPVTRRLLEHWADPDRDNKILFCQREAAETAIFLAEAASKWSGAWVNNDLDAVNAEHNNGLPRLALKMATGSGKTVVMAMLIAWHTINKVNAPYDRSYAKRFLVVTPGLTIRDRLRVLLPEDPENYYKLRDLVPAEYLADLGQAKIVITNFHSFQQRETRAGRGLHGNTKAFLNPDRPNPFQETPAQMVTRVLRPLAGSSEIVVLNDEAHHCYRGRSAQPEDGAAMIDNLTGEERKQAQEEAEHARIWFTGLEMIRDKVGIKRVYDLSATPFFLAGSGYREGTLFPWVVSDFSLIDAIESGIVKIPRVPVDDDRVSRDVAYLDLWSQIRDQLPRGGRRKSEPFSAEDLPDHLTAAIHSLYGSYEKSFKAWETSQAAAQGQPPPVFIVVCSNTTVSKAVYDYIGGWDREVQDTTVPVPGKLPLFSNVEDSRWLHRPRTILVDAAEFESGKLSDEFRRAAGREIEEFKQEYAQRFPGRSADDLGDVELLREVMNTVGKAGKLGEPVRCVVSVSMLTEGWDANTVTHILGVRAFGTQLICEQVVGRGLRRRSYAVDENGMFTPEYADVYGVPFQFIPTVAASRELTLKPTRHVRAEPDRAKLTITFPRVVGYHVEMPDQKLIADLSVPEARMVLSKADFPTVTVVSGLTGETDEHDLEKLRQAREQQIAYALAARVLERKLRNSDQDPKPWYFPQLLTITRQWMDECVTLHDDAFYGMLRLREAEAAEKIYQTISQQGDREKYVLPVLRSADPVGSTAVVDFHTTREVFVTRPDRCPVNFVTLDGSGGNAWERSVAQALESMDDVAAYVKNDHLDFAIPYEHAGRTHRFYPDFLVRLADRGDGVTRTLMVEVSGGRKAPGQTAQKAWAARNMWVPAVNNSGRFGRWSFCELRDPTRAKLDLAPAIAALYAGTGLSTFTDLMLDEEGAT
ncbi:DEAD/DEAH box helicase family protein [Solwaraspora sp. WMMD937]|uniref:BPTD_3080 family restriction endonuclease n=1 Tax=Solwaraspora sp. WMMD937 TaxID=3016090 RepID=UPI00249B6704|nr:DEAD/DEAH box helicase family protein [Solwaraspora sp. WMMD937]WFE20935.1 DEAD/DEAH box helicase family protein [Solwaraspora sp. WMMD937]